MKTSKLLVASVLFMTFCFTGFTEAAAQRGQKFQNRQEQRKKIEAQKIAFITNRVGLTPAEAEKFWPIYNENRDKLEAEREAFGKKKRPRLEELDTLSDEQAKDLLNEQLGFEQKMLDMRKAFDKKLLTVLPPQKVLKLHAAEQEFKLELMRRMAGKQLPDKGPGGTPPRPEDF